MTTDVHAKNSRSGSLEGTSFLARLLAPPTEDSIYLSYFEKDLWSLDEFASLVAGLTPDRFKEFEQLNEIYSKNGVKKCLVICKTKEKFLKSLRKDILEFSVLNDNHWYMSPWKFIKWLAGNDTTVSLRFVKALPRHLVELYLEFTPLNVDFRTQPKQSNRYHRALYVKHAQFIYDKSHKKLSPKDIYRHPHMQDILYTIRASGGSPKERTITESWLKDIDDDRKRVRIPLNPISHSALSDQPIPFYPISDSALSDHSFHFKRSVIPL